MKRKTYIWLISTLIGCLGGLLITWVILKVSPGDNWTLGKAVFASEEKILEHAEKVDKIDDKLKKSIAKKPLNWLSKKIEEDTAKEIAKGNFGAVVSAIRTYVIILIVILSCYVRANLDYFLLLVSLDNWEFYLKRT